MTTAIQIGLLLPLLMGGAGRDATEHVRIERLSDRVLLAYWIGTGRCNLTAIQSQKGLAIIDTEMSPRIMAPIKERIEREFGRRGWAYVINTRTCTTPEAIASSRRRGRRPREPARRLMAINSRPGRPKRRPSTTPMDHTQHASGNRANARDRGETRFWRLFIRTCRKAMIVKPTLTFADRHTLGLGDVTLEMVFMARDTAPPIS